MNYDAFTSDPHYFHKNIIRYCDRPFSSVEEMNETMIQRYNELIGPKDTVLWVGDCFFGKVKPCKEVMNRLNGKKHLILGNHDYHPHMMAEMGFELITDRIYGVIAGRKVVIIHYDQWKYRSIWDDRYENRRYDAQHDEVIIHGHTHQKSKSLLNQVHVGVDAWNFTPALRSQVEEEIKLIPHLDSRDKNGAFTLEAQSKLLFEYRDLLRKNSNDPLLQDEKFDFLRGLGWQKETKMREK
jgi:calcineurin-like phosphoesterase family protein